MKLKITYLLVFIVAIWLGMTKTGRNLLGLTEQTSEYIEKHNEYTVRFFGNSEKALPAVLKPAKRGVMVPAGYEGEMTYTASNLSPENKSVKFSVHITPPDFAQYLEVEHVDPIEITAGSSKSVTVKFTLSENIPNKIEMLYLHLKVSRQ